MKKYKENIIPTIILIIISSFMIFIYEPIVFYSSNITDLWFDIKLFIPNILLYFTLMIVGLSIFYTLIYFISTKLLKKEKLYKIILIISFTIFLITYIQGNYLAGNLPILDGSPIDWNAHKIDDLISVLMILTILIFELIIIKRFKLNKTIKINKYITLAIFVMLIAPLCIKLSDSDIYTNKIIPSATYKNINNSSTDKNFYIFLADAVDSIDFAKAVNDCEEYKTTFKDFTYYPDTVSAYLNTRDSIPFILSGIWNKNEKEFREYYEDAFKQSKFLNTLKEQKYEMNLYETEVKWLNENAKDFSNMEINEAKVDKKSLFKQLTKYIAYKYFPYPLKRFSRIEGAYFDLCKKNQENYFTWDNKTNYEKIKDEVNKVDNKHFKFIHIEGAHEPFNYDENLNIIPKEQGTYDKKIKSTIKVIDAFIQKLRNSNTYENSVIIILADHGGNPENGMYRQNPILYIKGIDEHHEMITSDIPLSYEDLNEAYIELLEGKKSTDLFKNIDINRIRKFLKNPYEEENHMVEYEQKGKAWDKSTISETGQIYER